MRFPSFCTKFQKILCLLPQKKDKRIGQSMLGFYRKIETVRPFEPRSGSTLVEQSQFFWKATKNTLCDSPIFPLQFKRYLLILSDMKLFVVRHGETDWNVKELACGVSESTLTEKGRLQAQDLANRLGKDKEKNNITMIYVSPLKRARDTAAYIEQALGLTALPEPRLHEIDFGDFEGKPWNNPDFLYIHKNPFLKFPGGESFAQVAHRAYSIIEDIKHTHKGDGNILFVCHGVFAAAVYTYFTPFSTEELLRLEIKNCQSLEFDL